MKDERFSVIMIGGNTAKTSESRDDITSIGDIRRDSLLVPVHYGLARHVHQIFFNGRSETDSTKWKSDRTFSQPLSAEMASKLIERE